MPKARKNAHKRSTVTGSGKHRRKTSGRKKALSRESVASLRARLKNLESDRKRLEKQLERKAGVKKLTGKQLQKKLAERKSSQLEQRQLGQAQKAVTKFRVSRADKGKIIFVGINGQRAPQKKGRKGYLVEITKTGTKRLIKQPKNGYRATTFSEAQAPLSKLDKTKRLQESKRVTKKGQQERAESWKHKEFKEHRKSNPVAAGLIRQKGEAQGSGKNDFNSTVVNALAKSIKKAIDGQESHRVFIVHTMGLVRLPDGTEHVIEFNVDIAKADHILVKLTGVKHFVERKFYAFLARELAFLGFVSSGSDNHIRSLPENKGKPRKKWQDKRGDAWSGRNLPVANVLLLEWKIEQAK